MTSIEARKALLLDRLVAKGSFFTDINNKIHWSWNEWVTLKDIDPKIDSEFREIYPEIIK